MDFVLPIRVTYVAHFLERTNPFIFTCTQQGRKTRIRVRFRVRFRVRLSHPIWLAVHAFPSNMDQESTSIKKPRTKHTNSDLNHQTLCTTSTFHVSEPHPPPTIHASLQISLKYKPKTSRDSISHAVAAIMGEGAFDPNTHSTTMTSGHIKGKARKGEVDSIH